MPDITNFTARYNNLARMNRFKVTMDGTIGEIEFFAKGATLPASTVPAMDVQYQGRVLKLDGDRTYEPFEMTVYGDPEMSIRKQLETLQQQYNGVTTNVGDFQQFDMFVTLLNRNGSEAIRFQLFGCMISTIASVGLDWGTNDSPMEFSVTIDYNYHDIV